MACQLRHRLHFKMKLGLAVFLALAVAGVHAGVFKSRLSKLPNAGQRTLSSMVSQAEFLGAKYGAAGKQQPFSLIHDAAGDVRIQSRIDRAGS